MKNNLKKFRIGLILSLLGLAVFVFLFIQERSARIDIETEYEANVTALDECDEKVQSLSKEFGAFTLLMKDSIMSLQGHITEVMDTVGQPLTDEECLEAFQFYKSRSDQLYQELLEDQRRLSAYVVLNGYIPQDSIDAIVTRNDIPDSYDLYRVISDSVNIGKNSQ